MWVRSQNKEMLINANNIRIISDSRSYCIICDFYDGDYYYLGEYSIKEKAMKVMNEIHNFILDFDYSRIVFQMPADEEV